MSESLERAKNVISDYQTDMDGSFENAAILEREFQVLLRAHETAMARITELESKPFPHCDKCGSSAWWCNGCSAEKALIERHDRNITDAAIEIVAVRKERDEATSDVLRLRDIVRRIKTNVTVKSLSDEYDSVMSDTAHYDEKGSV